MYKIRQSSKNKKTLSNITKKIPPKTLELLATNNKKKQNNNNKFLPFSLIKSRSIIPFSSNTSRNQKYNNLNNIFENFLNNQKSQRNSTIKNKSLLNIIIKPKSKSKSKSKRGISTQKPTIRNMKNSSYLANNAFIKNIILKRRKNKNKNKNNMIKIMNNKTQNNNHDLNINYSKSRSDSIRCSLTHVNRYSFISKPDKPKIKYDDCICITSNENTNNKKIITIFEKNKKLNKNKKWLELLNNLENLKTKTKSLMNKYYYLCQDLSNELEILNSNYEKNIFANNKSYDYRKNLLVYNKNDEKQLINEYIDKRYINTDTNNF